MFYFFVLINVLFFIAWFKVEKPTSPTSRGISTCIIGCLMVSSGMVSLTNDGSKLFCWFLIFAGLLMAFYGTARFIIYELKH